MDAARVARQGAGDGRFDGHALSRSRVCPARAGQRTGRRGVCLRQCTPGQRAGLFQQLLRAASRRPGNRGNGTLPAADRGGTADGLRGRYVLAWRDPDGTGRSTAHAQPGSVVYRGRRNPSVDARVGASGQPGLYRAAIAGPAGQHHGAAHGQLARCARPVSERPHGAGDGDVDRPGDGAGDAGTRHAPAPARRARPGGCAGISQSHGRFAGHGPARARPAGTYHLRQSRILRDGRVHAGGIAGARNAGALLAARTGR